VITCRRRSTAPSRPDGRKAIGRRDWGLAAVLCSSHARSRLRFRTRSSTSFPQPRTSSSPNPTPRVPAPARSPPSSSRRRGGRPTRAAAPSYPNSTSRRQATLVASLVRVRQAKLRRCSPAHVHVAVGDARLDLVGKVLALAAGGRLDLRRRAPQPDLTFFWNSTSVFAGLLERSFIALTTAPISPSSRSFPSGRILSARSSVQSS
jgi:hypothetical protein